MLSLEPKKEALSPQDRNLFLQEQPYWQVGDSNIRKLALDLKTPQAIFQYVVTHLSYDFSRVAGKQVRVGAQGVLQKPDSAVCLEFTDLFITLARAAGIPAREIDGYGFTQNQKERPLSRVQDILHAWPEYYDDAKQTWVMVDPTWENTTRGVDYFSVLDFDHIAFVIKGVSSTYPIPPGGYKFDGNFETKDVTVTFGDPVGEEQQKAGIAFITATSVYSGFPLEGELFVKNAGSQLIPSEDVTILSKDLTPSSRKLQTDPIPPYGHIQQTIGFDKIPLLTNSSKTITIHLAGNTITKIIAVHPIFFQKEYIIGGILLVILCIILFVVAARSRHLPIPR